MIFLTIDQSAKTAEVKRGNRVAKWWNDIKKDANDGKLYRFYFVWVIATFLIGTVVLIYVYYFAGLPPIIKEIIFFMLMVTIGITNYQSLGIAIDFARRAESQAETFRKGEILIGTIMNKFEAEEKKQAIKDGRVPRNIQEIADEFADALIKIYKAALSIDSKMQDKNISIEKITDLVQSALDHTQEIEEWSERLKKLMPVFEAIASSVENIDQKELGRLIGDAVGKYLNALKQEEAKAGDKNTHSDG